MSRTYESVVEGCEWSPSSAGDQTLAYLHWMCGAKLEDGPLGDRKDLPYSLTIEEAAETALLLKTERKRVWYEAWDLCGTFDGDYSEYCRFVRSWIDYLEGCGGYRCI